MSRHKHLTNGEINDEVAADALASGGKSAPPTVHDAMQNANVQQEEQDPDANATDASEADNEWDDYNG